MNQQEREARAAELYKCAVVYPETPPSQKFSIGAKVRAIKDDHPIVKVGDIFTVEYSYYQKYPDFDHSESSKNEYALNGTMGSIAWVSGDILEAA